jgi:ankyrin repeat protein
MLLAAGADPTIKSNTGETALDWARKYGNPRTLALLNDGRDRSPSASIAAGPVDLPSADALRR